MLFRWIACILLSLSPLLSAYELSVLAMFRDEARYLKEWIDYHRLVGVEHFWLYNDHSKDGWQEVLQSYVDEGVVEIFDWTSGGDTYGYTRQPAIYRDGIVKAIGKTQWLAIIDIDEFIVPMKDQTIPECLKTRFQKADAIYVNWRNFGTSKVTVPEGESLLYYLTACAVPAHARNSVGKCIVKPEKVVLETISTPHHYDLTPNTLEYYNGSGVPFPMKDFQIALKNNDRFLRINHYVLRDEYFFWNFRYPRTGEKVLAMEHYNAFCMVKDTAILRFVKALYPKYFVGQEKKA